MYWRDLELAAWPGDWQGLEVVIERGDRPARPTWRIEAAVWSYLRASDAGGPLLWATRNQGAQGLWWLLADRGRAPVVPPIEAGDLRAAPEPSHGRAWWRSWACWFARALVSSSSSPLHPGRWALALGEHRPARAATLLPGPRRWDAVWAAWWLTPSSGYERALDAASHRWTSWIGGAGDVVRLHPSGDGDRIRAWRKRARDGTLPPLLVMLARGMGLWLLLDGHDRLRAALEEGVPAPVLHLFVTTYAERVAADGVTPIVELVPSTNAWPIPGGRARWREEVAARLRALGMPADHALLDGLAPYEADRLGRATD